MSPGRGAPGEGATPGVAGLGGADEEAEREDDEHTHEELQALSEKSLAWALPRLNESQRMMIECDLQGLPIEEIMDRLDRKRDAVYKLRERAMKALMKLREEYEA